MEFGRLELLKFFLDLEGLGIYIWLWGLIYICGKKVVYVILS